MTRTNLRELVERAEADGVARVRFIVTRHETIIPHRMLLLPGVMADVITRIEIDRWRVEASVADLRRFLDRDAAQDANRLDRTDSS